MISLLFNRNRSAIRVFRTPDGKAAYAIGDIHGCYKKMVDLLERIELHAKVNSPLGYKLVFLGDLIDRGPRSKDVVSFLMHYKPVGGETIFLMGNHEEVFLSVLNGNDERLAPWFGFGGRECLRSYGVENLGEVHMNPENLLSRVQSQVPNSHRDFISSFDDYYLFGDYLFVHAGIRPGKELIDQKSKDLRWIRQSFLNYEKPHAQKIIHGHTIVEEGKDYGNRIAIDTGGYNGGPLTALFLQGVQSSFITSEVDEDPL